MSKDLVNNVLGMVDVKYKLIEGKIRSIKMLLAIAFALLQITAFSPLAQALICKIAVITPTRLDIISKISHTVFIVFFYLVLNYGLGMLAKWVKELKSAIVKLES